MKKKKLSNIKKKRRMRTRHMPTKVFEKDNIKLYSRKKKHKKKVIE
jgi:hypothetical protein